MDETGGKTGMERYFHLKSHQLQSLLARKPPARSSGRLMRARASPSSGRAAPHSQSGRSGTCAHARSDAASRHGQSNAPSVQRSASLHWASSENLWLTGLLPQFQRFRHDPAPRVDVALLPDDEEERLLLHRVVDERDRRKPLHVPVDAFQRHSVPLESIAIGSVTPWLRGSLLEDLMTLAQGGAVATGLRAAIRHRQPARQRRAGLVVSRVPGIQGK